MDLRPTNVPLTLPAGYASTWAWEVTGADLTGATATITAPLTVSVDEAGNRLEVSIADTDAVEGLSRPWLLAVALDGDDVRPWLSGRLVVSDASQPAVLVPSGSLNVVSSTLTVTLATRLGTPLAVEAPASLDATADVGTSERAAREDHVHDRAGLATDAEVASAVADHAADNDPHGDRAYALGLVDARVTFSDASTAPAASARYVVQDDEMTATHTVILPDASEAGAGHEIEIADESGTVTAENRLIITPSGSDTIGRAGTAAAIVAPFGRARFRSDGVSSWLGPTDVVAGTLEPVRYALAAAAAGGDVNVLFLGDSISEGQGSPSDSQLSGRWVQVALDMLRSACGLTGGRGYVPAYYDINSTDYPPATVGFARSGTITLDTLKGLGRRAAQLGSGGTLTITQMCTAFDVVYRMDEAPNAGVFHTTVDGGSPMVIDTTASPAVYGGYRARVTPSTRAERTIVISRQSGLPIIEGVMFYDGDVTAGLKLWEGAKSGYTANSFASNATWLQSINAAVPSIVVMAWGTNDFRTARTPAQFAANLATIISGIRTATYPYPQQAVKVCEDVPIVLVHLQDPHDGDYSPRRWNDYRDVLASMAASLQNVALIDVGRRMLKGRLMSADSLHPSPSGHYCIGSTVAGEILAGWHT